MFKIYRRLCFNIVSLGFVMCTFFPLLALAGEFPGKVIKVEGETITVRLNEAWIPDNGDRITFSRNHRTLGTIFVGEGIVVDNQQAPVLIVTKTKGEGDITVGTDSVVHSQSTKPIAAKEDMIRFPDPIRSPHDESLIKAVQGNDLNAVKKFITHGANVNAALGNSTPLMIAAENGNIQIVKLLLDSGAEPNIESEKWGSTALKLAARWDHIRIVDVLLDQGVDINYRGRNIKDIHLAGAPALSYAANNGHGPMVTHLIARGANPNLENFQGLTPLFYAASEGKIEAVNALLNAGVLVDQASSSGLTPLMAAAQADGHWDLAVYLLGAGANPDKQISESGKVLSPDAPGMTALMISVLVGDEELFSTLLVSGANPTMTRADGKTALDLATENLQHIKPGSKEYEKMEMIQRALLHPDWGKQKAMEIVAEELENAIDDNNFVIVSAGLRIGVDPNVRIHGEPLFFSAIEGGNMAMVELMLEHGGDPNVKNDQGLTAFYASLYKEHTDVAKLLITKGADPNILPPEENETLLHEYAGNGDTEGVRLLVLAGMHVDVRDNRQNTPLHRAARRGELETFKILLDAGADPTLQNTYGERPTDQVFDKKKTPLFLKLLPGLSMEDSPKPPQPLTRQEQISEAKGSKTDEFDLGDLDF